uniref:Serrate RNA effector molecule homolog (Arabidopsis) n=1 Tax=Astyanax mexicanus TaxID=7994 RepID=A0A8B9HHZ8_ASTMX
MADSDDEYDRRRRDKFRRERSDYDRSREREDRRRDDWITYITYIKKCLQDYLCVFCVFVVCRRPSAREWDRGRERRSRGEYRDYERGRRERFSPPRHDMSPQQKRMRRDWDDHGGDPYHGGYDLGYGGGGGPSYAPPQPWGHPDMHLMQPHHGIPIQARLGNIHEMDLGPPPPVMKSFKEFLLSLDDSVDETESVKRYNEYKIEFRRQQMQDFFLAHKDEEWFRSKYHPDESSKRKADAHAALQNRLNVFMDLMENSWFDSVSMDIDRAPQILKILDAGERRGQYKKLQNAAYTSCCCKKRKRKHSGDSEDEASASESESDSDSDSNSRASEKPAEREREAEPEEGEEKEEDEEDAEGEVKEQDEEKEREKEKEEKKVKDDQPPRPRPLHKTSSLFMRSIAPTISKAEIVALCRRYPGFMRVCLSDPQPELDCVLDVLKLYINTVLCLCSVGDWEKTFEEKLVLLFSVKETLSEDEAVKMGRKDPEQEVEKFVTANTQELGKDKWLCPLSGKKFKGPEFVRKHILNKHGDKIEEVKKEVEFFNNFLMDAKRPSLPEMKPPPPPVPGQGLLSPTGPPFPPQGPQGLLGFGQPRPPLLGYAGPPFPANQYGGGGRGSYDNFRGQGGYPGKPRNNRMIRGDPRNIIEYRDLDAPDDVDFF